MHIQLLNKLMCIQLACTLYFLSINFSFLCSKKEKKKDLHIISTKYYTWSIHEFTWLTSLVQLFLYENDRLSLCKMSLTTKLLILFIVLFFNLLTSSQLFSISILVQTISVHLNVMKLLLIPITRLPLVSVQKVVFYGLWTIV